MIRIYAFFVLILFLNVKSSYKITNISPLMHIIERYSQQNFNNILEIYICMNADIDATDSIGNTALFYAIKHLNHDAVHSLIINGADVKKVNYIKQTTLIKLMDTLLCMPNKSEDDYCIAIDIANLLITNEVDINANDVCSYTALCLAEMLGNQPLIDFLSLNGARKNEIFTDR